MIVSWNSQPIQTIVKNLAFPALIFLTALISCEKKPAVKQIPLRSSSFNLKALADRIIERSKPQPGEKVFMIGRPNEFDSLIVFLKDGFEKSGAQYLGTINVDTTQWPADWNTPLVQAAKGKSREELANLLDTLDLGIIGLAAGHAHRKGQSGAFSLGRGQRHQWKGNSNGWDDR
jgi:hypothetical protein